MADQDLEQEGAVTAEKGDTSTQDLPAGDQESTETGKTADVEGQDPPEGDAEEGSSGDDAGGEGDASVTYEDFTLPEGMEIDSGALERASAVFSELGVGQEDAQKLVDIAADMQQSWAQQAADARNQLVSDWENQTRNLPGFKENFDESVSIANAALTKFGTPELKEFLIESGLGNHPELVKTFFKIGSMTQEDDLSGKPRPSSPEKDRISLMYPNESK